jgi:hypothetical protein
MPMVRRQHQKYLTFHCLCLSVAILTAGASKAEIFEINVDNQANTDLGFGIIPLGLVSAPSSITGTLTVDVQFDNNQVSSIQFLGGTLHFADTTLSGDINIFGMYPGTLSAAFAGVSASPTGGPFTVTDGYFAQAGLDYLFNQGTLDVNLDSSISGPVALPSDFGASPTHLVAVAFSGDGVVGWDGQTLSLDLPIQIGTTPTNIEGIDVYFAIQAQVSGVGTAAVVPEASSWAMLILAGGAATGVQRLRRRQAV